MKTLNRSIFTCCLLLAGIAYAAAMTDGQVAKIVLTTNEAEVSEAKLAMTQAQNKSVKDFAKKMVDEHNQNTKKAKSLTKKEKIKVEESAAADSLKKQAMEKFNELRTKKGKEFDRAYMDHQVQMHQMVLADLNDNLIPNAQNPNLKAHLEETRTHVESHLQEAKQIQTTVAQ